MTFAHALAALLEAAVQDWSALKDVLKGNIGLHDDALHVVAGVLLQLAAALALRRQLASPLPWLAVLALELANEASDLLIEHWPDRAHQLSEGGWDLVMTMVLPTVVLLVARLHRLRRDRPEPG